MEYWRYPEGFNNSGENNSPIKDFETLDEANKFILDTMLNGFYIKDNEEIHLNGELYVMEVYANDLQF